MPGVTSDIDARVPHVLGSDAGVYEMTEGTVFSEALSGSCVGTGRAIGRRVPARSAGQMPLMSPDDVSEMRWLWSCLDVANRYLMVLVSEHMFVTGEQMRQLVVVPSVRARRGLHDVIAPYFSWLVGDVYGMDADEADACSVTTDDELFGRLSYLVGQGLICVSDPDEYAPIGRDDVGSVTHYYLSCSGAELMMCNTRATKPDANSGRNVGYSLSGHDYSVSRMSHEADCMDVVCSAIDGMRRISDSDGEIGCGYVDMCRVRRAGECRHELSWSDMSGNRHRMSFAPDCGMTMYSSRLDGFVDYYLCYDSGSATMDGISRDIEAFLRHVDDANVRHGGRVRMPVLMMVTRAPGDFLEYASVNRKVPKYVRGMRHAMESMPYDSGRLSSMSNIVIADYAMIRDNGAMGPCWHHVDLLSGTVGVLATDLLSSAGR